MASGNTKAEMPDDLVRYLSGGRLVVAATIDDDGLPYTMVMNSAVATGPHAIRFAIDHRTHSLRHIRANGRMMFEIIGDELVYGVRGTAKVILDQMQHAPVPSALVEMEVETVKRDLPPGVSVTGPMFHWGPLAQFMDPIEPAMFEELRTFAP